MGTRSSPCPERNAPKLRYAAAALAFASQLIHLWVLPGQLVAAMLPGAFFLLVAMGEGLLGARLLFDAGRWALRLGILLNLLVIFVWAVTRMASVPELFEPLRLPIENLGAVATSAEATLVVLLLRLRRNWTTERKHGPGDRSGSLNTRASRSSQLRALEHLVQVERDRR